VASIAASEQNGVAGPAIPALPGPLAEDRSLAQIIAARLREGVFDGTYPPGSRLNIADLAGQFSVSAVPVREALRNLETEGLVEFRLNKGATVRELSAAEVRELYMIRWPLESLAAVEAARRADDGKLNDLNESLVAMDAAAGTERWHALHGRFHERLNELCDMPRLFQLIAVLRGQMRPYSKTYLNDPAHVFQAQAEHYQLLRAMREGDESKIRTIIRDHLRRPTQLAIMALGQAGPAEIDYLP
jgi:DNA-binding GntR family transcriptional regulator